MFSVAYGKIYRYILGCITNSVVDNELIG